VDGARLMTAFDTETGARVWTARGASNIAAPTVGPDGTIYSGGGRALLALNPQDGSRKWAVNYDFVAESFLQHIPSNDSYPTGLPIARTNSVVTVSARTLWVVLVLGYEFVMPGTGAHSTQPHIMVLASLNPASGSLLSTTRLRDTSEGVISLGSDGRVYVSHSARLSSIFYYQINPLLPDSLKIPGPPLAGISVLAPLSFRDHAIEGVQWAADLNAQAMAELPGCATALEQCHVATVLQRGCTQLGATANSLLTDVRNEVPASMADAAHALVVEAREGIASAMSMIETNPVQARQFMENAQSAMRRAETLLGDARVQIDILPAKCPNVLQPEPHSKEKVEVAIVGTPDFEVWRINLVSLALSRDDGIGGVVRPLQRREWPAVRFADVAAPADGTECDCRNPGPDGIVDRVLTFSAQEMVEGLKLGSRGKPTPVAIKLTGSLIDGKAFVAWDCLTLGRRGE